MHLIITLEDNYDYYHHSFTERGNQCMEFARDPMTGPCWSWVSHSACFPTNSVIQCAYQSIVLLP